MVSAQTKSSADISVQAGIQFDLISRHESWFLGNKTQSSQYHSYSGWGTDRTSRPVTVGYTNILHEAAVHVIKQNRRRSCPPSLSRIMLLRSNRFIQTSMGLCQTCDTLHARAPDDNYQDAADGDSDSDDSSHDSDSDDKHKSVI